MDVAAHAGVLLLFAVLFVSYIFLLRNFVPMFFVSMIFYLNYFLRF